MIHGSLDKAGYCKIKTYPYSIAEDSKHHDKKVTHAIKEKTNILYQYHRIGRAVPEVGKEEIRELLIYSYRITCETRNDQHYILLVIHQRQGFSEEHLP